jgi:hypothetical protein
MRKWWTNVRIIEAYLNGQLDISKATALRAMLSRNGGAKRLISDQKIAYEAIHWYGRKQLKRRLKKLNHRLLHQEANTDLYREIQHIFKG